MLPGTIDSVQHWIDEQRQLISLHHAFHVPFHRIVPPFEVRLIVQLLSQGVAKRGQEKSSALFFVRGFLLDCRAR